MKIPFGKTFSVTPAQSRDGVAQGLIDGYQDHDGAYKSRMGLTAWSTLESAGVDGIFVNTNGDTIAVNNGKVWVIDIGGTEVACTGPLLTIGNICTFCEDSSSVFIAYGGQIAQVDVAAKTVTLLDTATAPDGVTHIVYIQGYLIANGTSGLPGDTFYTGPYTAVDYLSVFEVWNNESLPDGCSALGEDGQLVYAFGQKSIEVSVNDGTTPWAKFQSSFIPYGIEAAHSLAKLDSTFFWLGEADNALRVMRMVGGNAKTISTPYDSIFNSLAVTSDAYAFSYGENGHSFYVLQFPTEQKTFVYHLQSDAWYQWGNYDLATASYKGFLGRCHVYHSVLNKNLTGATRGGYIGVPTGFTDFGDLIRFELTSGNVRSDTYKQKRASRMRFQLQRGETSSPTAHPFFTWSHRDDGLGWKPERNVSLGQLGQYGYLGQLERCGIYRERQHRIVFTDPTCQFVFVEAEEQTRGLQD